MVASNRDVSKVLCRVQAAGDGGMSASGAGTLQVRTFEATQLLFRRHASPEMLVLTRGTTLQRASDVSATTAARLERVLGDYLARSVQPNGRMRYQFYPSRGEEDTQHNNMVRQWMATLALCRLAQRRRSDALFKLAERNIRFNLEHFYQEEGPLGLIVHRGMVKLGAVALAVMALREHQRSDDYRDVQGRLLSTIDRLWQSDGSFRTFLKPANRNDQQNFYPGEALLAWSCCLSNAPPESDSSPVAGSVCGGPTLAQLFNSFRFYRAWHRARRNPAFIPWHTQAYYKLWAHTQDRELSDFVLEMNDWLLSMQQWDDAPHPDCRGRFYNPRKPFGPPHASSTGAYLEGLVDAFALARQVNDQVRADAYRIAILRGLRSVLQLTFKDDVDMFYVQGREQLLGAVRTTVYNNVVRVDNVQHNLMALMKILDVFSEEDYQHAAPV
jgi:hypothetical protein